jgi:hypothetical protein
VAKKILFGLNKAKRGKKGLKKRLKKGIINAEGARWHSFLIQKILLKKRPEGILSALGGRLWYPLFTISTKSRYRSTVAL